MINSKRIILGLAITLVLFLFTGCSSQERAGLISNPGSVSIVSAPVPNATNISVATSTGGTLQPDTYYFVVTSVGPAGGETAPSSEYSCAVGAEMSGTSTACSVTLASSTLAVSTKLWVSTISGVYSSFMYATSSTLVATTTGLTTAVLPTTGTAFLNTYDGNSFLATTTDAIVKSGAGMLKSLIFSCNDAAPTAGTIDIYDNTSGSGTKIFSWTLTTTAFTPVTVDLDVAFSTGLYIDFTTTEDVNVTSSFK